MKKLIITLSLLLLVCISSACAASMCISDCESGSRHNCVVVCGSPGTPLDALEKTLKWNLALGQKGDPRRSPNTHHEDVMFCDVRAPARLALLVRDAAALDTEEKAALEFAQSQGLTVTAIDAETVQWQEGVLSRFQGFWADSDTEPVEWKDPVALAALRRELESGKRLFMMTAGTYIGEYLGYGTVHSDGWGPVLLDEVYLVDIPESTHPVLAGLNRWVPPSQPDNLDQVLWKLRETGGFDHFWFEGTNDSAVEVTGLWTRYGWWPDSVSPCPDLDARYGVESNEDRFLFTFPLFREVAVGEGSMGYEGVVFSLTHEWGTGPMGEKVLANKITWVMGGGEPASEVVQCGGPHFTCRSGQYRNLGECVSECQPGWKQSCEETCKACIGTGQVTGIPVEEVTGIPVEEDAVNPAEEGKGTLALLVRNVAALDSEEKAALQLVQARGINVTPVDATMVKSQAGILSRFGGFWAASDTQPVEWKDPVVLTALRGELVGGKRLFMMAGSMYLGQYLGSGTAGIDSWGPCVLDEVYFVDNQASTHPVLANLSSWIPPSKPDNPDQLLWKLRRTGGWSHFTFRGNNETAVQATGIWARYGFAPGSPSPYPALDARYGITSTGERFLFSFPAFRELPVGQGSLGYPGLVIHLTREWGLGPMGEKLFTNTIQWTLGG